MNEVIFRKPHVEKQNKSSVWRSLFAAIVYYCECLFTFSIEPLLIRAIFHFLCPIEKHDLIRLALVIRVFESSLAGNR